MNEQLNNMSGWSYKYSTNLTITEWHRALSAIEQRSR